MIDPYFCTEFFVERLYKEYLTHKKLFANGYVHPLTGVKITGERLEKMKLAPCIKIYQYDKNLIFIREWDSIKMAADSLNIHASNITSCAKNKVKSAGGFIWKYEKTA